MNLSQTSCLVLLKGVDDLGKLYGGHVVATLSNVLLRQLEHYFLCEFALSFNSSSQLGSLFIVIVSGFSSSVLGESGWSIIDSDC